ncbi:MAG TPA: aspartyl/asparaginyl beta-hydroxylase domain-containing protein [Steroidobacteraceae bacterium]|nr:aspartyl/asparaginyl beta-hydroxylase domain-containing protein [Steroidobacteraceae bacterium]
MSENPAGLNQAAMQALNAGDFATAQALLQRVVTADPASIPAWLNLAAVRRRLGDVTGAFDALREVMRREPRNFPALLMSATLLEREGSMKAAAAAYGAALSNAPPDHYLDRPTQQALAHGRELHGRHLREVQDFIRSRIGDTQSQCAPVERRRLDAFIDMTLRVRKRYQQEPLEYFYPGLPAIEFYEREEFPWLADLEAATEPMQQELAAILREDQAGFAPYIHYDDHMPLDQWRELNHSPRWSAFHFYEKGQPVAERCRRAPATMAVLSRLPQAQVPLRSPSALFSVLQPKTRIPPHTGVANFRLVVHLPLIVPPGCGFRVGGETRQWRLGEAWVFDDTIEHEAWNDSEQTRIIFICDIWSPRLSPDERVVIGEIIAATDAFNGTQPTSSV